MSIVIGSKYLENLARIKNVFNNANNGRDIKGEVPVVNEDFEGGRCYYDRCDKNIPSDIGAVILRSDGHVEYRFHRECFNDLLKDERFQGFN